MRPADVAGAVLFTASLVVLVTAASSPAREVEYQLVVREAARWMTWLKYGLGEPPSELPSPEAYRLLRRMYQRGWW